MNMAGMMEKVGSHLRAYMAAEIQAGRVLLLLSRESIQLDARIEEAEVVFRLTLPDGYAFEVREPITRAEIEQIRRQSKAKPWREPEEEVRTWLQSFSESPGSPPSIH